VAKNYTGSDLMNLCVAAAFACEYEQIKRPKKELEGPSPRKRQRFMENSAKKTARRTLHLRHFKKAKQEVASSVDMKNIRKIREFDQLVNGNQRPSEGNSDDTTETRTNDIGDDTTETWSNGIDKTKYWPRGYASPYHHFKKRINLPS
jgi:hypothetical protein